MEHEVDSDTICSWCTWNVPQKLENKTDEIENQMKNQNHSDYSSVKIGKNTEKGPGDLRRPAVTQTPAENNQLTTWKDFNDNNNNENENLPNSGLCRPDEPLSENQRKRKERQVHGLYQTTKKQWNIGVTVILIVVDALGTIPKSLIKVLEELKIRGRADTIQTAGLLSSVRILRKVQETWGDLLSLTFQRKTISYRWFENFAKNYNNNPIYPTPPLGQDMTHGQFLRGF